jgi:hypothetical protein
MCAGESPRTGRHYRVWRRRHSQPNVSIFIAFFMFSSFRIVSRVRPA